MHRNRKQCSCKEEDSEVRGEPFDFRALVAGLAVQAGIKADAQGMFFDFQADPELPRYVGGPRPLVAEWIDKMLDCGLAMARKGGQGLCLRIRPKAASRKGAIDIEFVMSGTGFWSPEEKKSLSAENGEARGTCLPAACEGIKGAREIARVLGGGIAVHLMHGWGFRIVGRAQLPMAPQARAAWMAGYRGVA